MRDVKLDAEVVREERSPDRLVQELRVPHDLDCWPGHFAGAELVPGVVQLHWVMRAIADWQGAPARLAEIAALKFKAFLLPGQEVSLELIRDGDGRRVQFRLARGDVLYSSGRIVLRDGAS
jgi:3-hydroxymyristoyl/3-hydroxydecanoyl-(acyl carrier protein) dehydratase